MFVYCTLTTVAIEDIADILRSFGGEGGGGHFSFWFLLIVLCILHAVSNTAYYDILYILTLIGYNYRHYIFCVLMYKNVFRTVFAQRICSTAPCQLCQRMYCAQCCVMSKLTRYIFAWRLRKYVWLGLLDPETYHDVLQNWTVINDSCCTGLIPLIQRTVLLQ